MQCKLCEQRKARRYCPGVTGEICSICCGNEREQTIHCPLECPHLQDAHDNEKPADISRDTVPNTDVSISKDFAENHEYLMHLVFALAYQSAIDTPGAIDSDLRDALEGVIRTLRTRVESGLYYDSRPENPLAASIYLKIQELLDELRADLAKEGKRIRESQLIVALVYLQRSVLVRNNGRRKCRSFLDILHRMFPELKPAASASALIIA